MSEDPRNTNGAGCEATHAAKGCANEQLVRHAQESHGKSDPFSLIKAFACAGAGVYHAFATQRNMRIHLAFAMAALVLAAVLRVSWPGWAAVIACIAVVFALECVNTAIEAVVDLASPEYAELAKHAKDCAAGAVLVAAIGSVAVAVAVYVPALCALVG